MEVDFETLGLTEIIRLQNQLSQVLVRRFRRELALGFSDIVGSTQYFSRFGAEAGRGLLQRHIDLLAQALHPVGGRVVDTAGDGAFTVFPSVQAAVDGFQELQNLVAIDNAPRLREHQLQLRIGVHFGAVLTDGAIVTGDPVNVCARVCGAATPGKIVMTRSAFKELPSLERLRCHPLGFATLKDLPDPVELLEFRWRDALTFPTYVRIDNTGQEVSLPSLDTISFGRLRDSDGGPSNDVVISIPDPHTQHVVSRWHFELRRHPSGFRLRPVSDQITEVDGIVVPKGADVLIRAGTHVRLGRGVSLTFLERPSSEPAQPISETVR